MGHKNRPSNKTSCRGRLSTRLTTDNPRGKREEEEEDGDDDNHNQHICHTRAAIGHAHTLKNLLLLPLETYYENLVSRTCYYAWYVLTRRSHSNYSDVQQNVLRSERVTKAVESATQHELESTKHGDSDYATILARNRKRATEQLDRLRSCISSSLMKIAGWILYRLLSRIFTSIQFNKAQIERLVYCKRQTTDRAIPIVYLPLHRSHLDYILISFILYMNNIKPPLVAAGDNLLIPFFGNLLRGLGAFFIRRSSKTNLHKDHIYQAVLHSYITENLKKGNSLEFFIEGGRTRSGKMMMPKLGLLKIVVDAVREGAVEDVYIVPVSIAYEKLVDGSFVDERLGSEKRFENFSLTSRAIWRALHSNYGNVRVDFSKPFLLKDYLSQACAQQLTSASSPKHSSTGDCVACKETVSPVNKFNLTRLSQELSIKSREVERKCIESLASHVLYDAHKDSALMSTHLVSFLLLTKYRKGVALERLAKDIEGLRDLLSREKAIYLSAFGDLNYFIKQAITFLGKDQIKTEQISMKWSSWARSSSVSNCGTRSMSRYRFDSNNTWRLVEGDCDEDLGDQDDSKLKIMYLRPSLRHASALHLHYYANSCIFLFHLESVFAIVLLSYTNGVGLDSLIYNPSTYVSNLTIEKQEFLERCRQLCCILQNEFYFKKTLEATLEEMFEVFVTKNIFVTAGRVAPPPSLLSNLHLPAKSPDGANYYTKLINGGKQQHGRTKRRKALASGGNKASAITANVITLPTLKEEEGEDSPSDSQYSSSQEEDEEEEEEERNANETRMTWTSLEEELTDSDESNNNHADFSILLSNNNCKLLTFYGSVLGSYVEAYWLTADRFMQLATTNSVCIGEKDFLADLTCFGKHLIDKNVITYEESISYDKFQNALKYMESIEAVKRIEQSVKSAPSSTILSMSFSSPPTPLPSKTMIQCDTHKLSSLLHSLRTFRHPHACLACD